MFRCASFAVFLGAMSLDRHAMAEPQANLGVTAGVVGRGYEREPWDVTAFHLGLRTDVLFGREGTGDFGVGPYAEAMTHAFDEFQIGGGASFLMPIVDTFPLIASAGMYGRIGEDDFGFEPGIATNLFFGSRSYNFTANYVMAFGLDAGFRIGLGESEEMSFLIAAQVDAAFLMLPVVFLIDAIRGGSPDTDKIERSARSPAPTAF